MRRMLIRYTTHASQSEENQRLIQAVFQELASAKPEGVRYLSLRLGQDSFAHLVESPEGAPSPLLGLSAFKQFQSGIKERCAEGPVAAEVTIVGNYRMLDE